MYPENYFVFTQQSIYCCLAKLLMFIILLKLPMCACHGLLIFISAALLGFTGIWRKLFSFDFALCMPR